MGGFSVIPMFDRAANIALAKGQTGFIDFVGMAMFSLVTQAMPKLEFTVDQMKINKQTWAGILKEQEAKTE
eukprot:NODE_3717_length_383_cov_197.559880_g3149_i0.p1 GENE.NODE_3717_length_383_cov_197.559880_g3149_i0~~NODE_3717_length_383_cov_197.559880_g3149_i0.p1  ORF type:complete len:81 (-),score=33.62 NODE_3717_length_383_cov_197.559880_g3149_i0:140-352(-)